MKTFVAIFAVLSLAAMSEAIFIPTIVGGGTAAGLSIPLIGGASATAGPALALLTTLAGGALALKGVGALALSTAAARPRGKRSATKESESTFAFIAQSEPQACYRRLICDLATGTMPASDIDVILASFNEEVPATSTKFEYAIAAQVGKALKNVESCELRYSCPLTGPQITKLFN